MNPSSLSVGDAPRVSVALCTYNGERFLAEQLASIAAQDRLPDELVVCDDGSTDTTIPQLEAFARTVPFFTRIVRNPQNLGSSHNFEQAIKLCRGEIIFLSDQDDVWRPHKVAVTLAWLDEHPSADAVFSDGDVIDEHSRPRPRSLWQSFDFTESRRRKALRAGLASYLARHCCVTGAALAFRRRLLERAFPFPARGRLFVHDAWIAHVAAITGELASLPERLIGYREHPAQQIGFGNKKGGGKTSTARREILAQMHVHARDIHAELQTRFGGYADRLEAHRRGIEHLRLRAELPASRLARLPVVLRELASGGYPEPALKSLKRAVGDVLM